MDNRTYLKSHFVHRFGILSGMIMTMGCGDAAPVSSGGAWLAVVDTVGDTITVRTVSGSEWGSSELKEELRIGAVDGADHEIFGELIALSVDATGNIYVYDRQVPALRKYAADGEYLMTLGREGGGPGEYANSDGGLAVLSDGRLVLRDPGNGRFTFYGPDGEYLEIRSIRGNYFSSIPIFPMADGGFYSPVFGGGEPLRLVKFSADGTPGDSFPPPDRSVEPATVNASVVGASQTWAVPFSESAIWTWHPDGFYLSAITGQYAIDLRRSEHDILRLAKRNEPVSVSSEERAAYRERVFRAMRSLVPSWTWNGPPIPQTKPILRQLYSGQDGRIWVRLYQKGELVVDSDPDRGTGGPRTIPSFREPTVFDVFEKDGRFLGRVNTPNGFSPSPQPTFRGDFVWGVETDDLGVQYVVRYRIVRSIS